MTSAVAPQLPPADDICSPDVVLLLLLLTNSIPFIPAKSAGPPGFTSTTTL
jgi:hypothetical protein